VKIRPVGSRGVSCKQTDRRTNLTKVKAACCSCSKRLIRETLHKVRMFFWPHLLLFTLPGAN